MQQKFTILFDLDGTLVDTAPDLMLAHNHVMRKFGYPTKSTDEIRNLVGKGAGALMGRSIWGQAKKEFHSVKDLKIKDENDVKRNWESLKLKEGNTSIFSGIPESLPEIIKSQRIQDKAAGVGFEWNKLEDVWEKVLEEKEEFVEAVKSNDKSLMEEEFGDLIFSLINYARFLKIDGEVALMGTNKKFIERIQFIEKALKLDNKLIDSTDLDELIVLWKESKIKF